MMRVARNASDELDLDRLRSLARKKPRTKAGQVRQAWPEIRALLEAGHALKDVCARLNECGVEIGYARLCDYVNQLRREQPAALEPAASDAAPETTQSPEPPNNPPQRETRLKRRDPLANVKASESKRPGFNYRPASPADEKDLI
jgi:hypothetical protein